MEDGPVSSSQELIHRVCFVDNLVPPKLIARRLHMHSNFISDACRRPRVDFMAIFNRFVEFAEQYAEVDAGRHNAICIPIFNLLTDGTSWAARYVPQALPPDTDYTRLGGQVGELFETLGGAIKSLTRIESGGKVDANDGPDIDLCQHRIGSLVHRLQALSQELEHRRRRAAQVQP